MTIPRTLLALLLFPIALHAQSLNHSLIALPGAIPVEARALQLKADTIDVLALMVQFQIDTDKRTTGNGRFELRRSPERISRLMLPRATARTSGTI